jgi:hypothetical protein
LLRDPQKKTWMARTSRAMTENLALAQQLGRLGSFTPMTEQMLRLRKGNKKGRANPAFEIP